LTESSREHAPKVAALRAEAAGLLSGEGRARLLRHVAGCEVCAEQLRGARRFHELVSRATGVPSFDSEHTVRSAVMRNRLVQRRTRIQWGGVLVAAGVLLAVVLATRHNKELQAGKQPSVAPQAPAASPVVESKLLAVAVTAVRGEIYVIEPARPERMLTIDDSVLEHSVLRSSARAALDLALGDEAAVHLAAQSEVALDAARSDRIALRLIRGELSNSVGKRSAQQSYEVIAAGHRVVVRGTLFAVRAGGDAGVTVQCDEGVVEVIAPDGKTTRLTAPASWREHVGGAAATAPAPMLEAIEPYAVRGGAVLTLPSAAGLEGWEIAGRARPASELLRMRVPPGAQDVVALLGGGRREVVHVEVDGIGAQIDPKDLAFLKAPEAAVASPVARAETEIDASSVILAGRPALQRCYERSLKNESSGSHALRLSISIDPRGRVKKVEPASQKPGEALPAELAQCIRLAVTSWQFPAPGGDGLQLEAPLRFQLRR
jgi:hypothetical protein